MLSNIPLKEDMEENKVVYAALIVLYQQQNTVVRDLQAI